MLYLSAFQNLLFTNFFKITKMKKHLLTLFNLFTIIGLSYGQIVFTEVNYNSHGTDDSDYLELYNNSGADINMLGYRFDQGFEFTFPDMVFPADSYMVLTVNAKSLMETYGAEGIQWTGGSLGNAEDILLADPNGNEIDYMAYDDGVTGWPTFIDGLGFALQLCDVNADNSLAENWQITNEKVSDSGHRVLYGTPGQSNTCIDGPVITSSRRLSILIESETPDTGTFVFYLENSNGAPSSVILSVDPSSTASPDDYNIINSEVVFTGLGDFSINVTISTNDDGIAEARENIIFNIEAGDNVAKSIVDQIEVLIYDNDRALDKGLVLVGVFDADDTDDFDNYGVELFAIKDIPDLSKYSVGFANNGGGTDGIEVPLPAISLNKRDNYFISDSRLRFFEFFDVESDLADPNSFITGDDAVELFEDGVVIDVFGEIDVDGTGEPWEFSGGWAKRVPDTGPDGTTFVFENWLFTGVDFLLGPTNDECPLPYVFDFYMYSSTDNVLADDHFDILPTITMNQLSVNFSDIINEAGSIVISNSQGMRVSKISFGANTQSIDIQTHQLTSGLYYLTVQTSNGVLTKRFMKI